MSLKIECHPKVNVPQCVMSLKWYVTKNGISLKMEQHSKWNVTQNGMSLKMGCRLKWNVTQM